MNLANIFVSGRALAVLAILALLPSTSPAMEKADLYVSPQGNDAWSGKLPESNAKRDDGPLATIAKAQLLVRSLRQAEPARQSAIVVAIRGGVYPLSKPITFTSADSGTPQAPVVYQAFEAEQPIFSGGVQIKGWTTDKNNRWHASLPDVKDGTWSFSQLFVNNQRRDRPRLPAHGYYSIADKVAPSPAYANRGFDGFKFSGEELQSNWANLGDVEVIGVRRWSASRMHIASIDPATRIVRFTVPTGSLQSWEEYAKGNRYRIDNVREALREPGQWYLDRPSGELTYIPMPGETPENTTVYAPRAERLLALAGDVAQRKWVQHLTFRGLTFAHANWTLGPNGQSFPQAEVNLDAAVSAMGARHITFDACAVRNVGQYAMAFGAGCQHNLIDRCEMIDMGGGGVMIGLARGGKSGSAAGNDDHSWNPSPRNDEELVSHHTVRNCLIAHGGRLHSAAIGVWIGHSPFNLIEHNDIYDFYYTGISVGWSWGYGQSYAHHNDIGFNHVHTIGQKVLSDMGGIYTLGISPGTHIHDNCFHDIDALTYGGWGMYTDEGSSGIVLENNVVYRTKTGGFHQHYGKENIVRNNIFAFAAEDQLQRTRPESHISFTFERNIVYWEGAKPLFGINWLDNHFKLANNVYWNRSGDPIRFPGGLTLEQWQKQKGQDIGSLVADPKFADAAAGDFRLADDSPARKLGFQPIDATQAGRKIPLVLTRDLPPVPKGFE